jgi:hypothetical protein
VTEEPALPASPVAKAVRPQHSKGRWLRVGFLAVLAGGLFLFARARSPREMVVEVDLTSALPGDIVETDVIVYRDGRSLARVDERHGARGAPATIRVPVRAQPGAATVEVTLVSAGGVSRRIARPVVLTADGPTRLQLRGGAGSAGDGRTP